MIIMINIVLMMLLSSGNNNNNGGAARNERCDGGVINDAVVKMIKRRMNWCICSV
jgi:hypothetical protein